MSRYKRPTHSKPNKSVWPIVMMIAGLVFLGGVLWTVFGQSPKAILEVTGQPSLKVNQATIDLGDQKLGNTVQATFKLTNVGDQPLRFAEKPYIEVVEGC